MKLPGALSSERGRCQQSPRSASFSLVLPLVAIALPRSTWGILNHHDSQCARAPLPLQVEALPQVAIFDGPVAGGVEYDPNGATAAAAAAQEAGGAAAGAVEGEEGAVAVTSAGATEEDEGAAV